MSSVVQCDTRLEQSDGEKLGDQITELCGQIYAATHHPLELIREFDEQMYWAAFDIAVIRGEGLVSGKKQWRKTEKRTQSRLAAVILESIKAIKWSIPAWYIQPNQKV